MVKQARSPVQSPVTRVWYPSPGHVFNQLCCLRVTDDLTPCWFSVPALCYSLLFRYDNINHWLIYQNCVCVLTRCPHVFSSVTSLVTETRVRTGDSSCLQFLAKSAFYHCHKWFLFFGNYYFKYLYFKIYKGKQIAPQRFLCGYSNWQSQWSGSHGGKLMSAMRFFLWIPLKWLVLRSWPRCVLCHPEAVNVCVMMRNTEDT